MSEGYTRVATDVIFRDETLGLRRDTVSGSEGALLERKVVEFKPACAVLAISDEREMLLVRHFRYPIGRSVWELPGGMIEPGESAADAAARELCEETGYVAADLRPLLSFHPEPAFTDHRITIFAAQGATASADAPPRETEIEDCAWFSLLGVNRMLSDGRIASSWTTIGALLAPGLGVR